jgi:Fe-S cluster biogenesis protein NfuA
MTTFSSKQGTTLPDTTEQTMKERVESILETIRPQLQADGGNVELVEVTEDNVVRVRLQGACAGCPMSQMTLKNGIERVIKEKIPEIKAVEAVK